MEQSYFEKLTAKRFKLFVEQYNAGLNTIAKATLELTESSFNSYVRGERKITSRGITAFCLSYGLNPGWVLGLSSIPYTEESIKLAEQHYQDQYPQDPLPYNNTITNLETKANIITLRRLEKIYKESKNIKKPGSIRKGLIDRVNQCLKTGKPVYHLK